MKEVRCRMNIRSTETIVIHPNTKRYMTFYEFKGQFPPALEIDSDPIDIVIFHQNLRPTHLYVARQVEYDSRVNFVLPQRPRTKTRRDSPRIEVFLPKSWLENALLVVRDVFGPDTTWFERALMPVKQPATARHYDADKWEIWFRV